MEIEKHSILIGGKIFNEIEKQFFNTAKVSLPLF